MRLNSCALEFLLVVFAMSVLPAYASGPESLYAQTAAQVLARNMDDPNASYLLYDLSTATPIASHWEDITRAIPVGSLVKPFTALAYAEEHSYRYPRFSCAGSGACWRPQGHGRIDISEATEFSCNSYFSQLAEQTSPSRVSAVAQRFGLEGPGISASSEALIGLNGVWREKPNTIALAYAELLRRREQPGVREIVEGMALCAQNGTGAQLGSLPRFQVLAKTGTARCTHARHGPGDGFVIVLWPVESPHYLLLVREHGQPGSRAAAVAARIIRLLEPR